MRPRRTSGRTRSGPSGYSSFPVQPDYFSKATPSHIRLCLAAMFTFPPIGVIGLPGLTNRCPPSGLQFTIMKPAATLSRGGDDYESVIRAPPTPRRLGRERLSGGPTSLANPKHPPAKI